MWHRYTIEYYIALKVDPVTCNNIDEPEGHYTKWNIAEKDIVSLTSGNFKKSHQNKVEKLNSTPWRGTTGRNGRNRGWQKVQTLSYKVNKTWGTKQTNKQTKSDVLKWKTVPMFNTTVYNWNFLWV